jgi:hypothetical protein
MFYFTDLKNVPNIDKITYLTGAIVKLYHYPAKLSHPGGVLMEYYLRGNTLIEAYRKVFGSRAGNFFVGERLLRPFASPPTKQTH